MRSVGPMNPGRLIAFARASLDQGPILLAEEPFDEEIRQAGWDISDHELPKPPESGLWLFEGWIEVGPDIDPDIFFVGDWRRLTHWEMCRLRSGMVPWD